MRDAKYLKMWGGLLLVGLVAALISGPAFGLRLNNPMSDVDWDSTRPTPEAWENITRAAIDRARGGKTNAVAADNRRDGLENWEQISRSAIAETERAQDLLRMAMDMRKADQERSWDQQTRLGAAIYSLLEQTGIRDPIVSTNFPTNVAVMFTEHEGGWKIQVRTNTPFTVLGVLDLSDRYVERAVERIEPPLIKRAESTIQP